MGLIIGRADIRAAFEKAWTASYVPSLLRYGERSKRKVMKGIHLQLVETGKFKDKYCYMKRMFDCSSLLM